MNSSTHLRICSTLTDASTSMTSFCKSCSLVEGGFWRYTLCMAPTLFNEIQLTVKFRKKKNRNPACFRLPRPHSQLQSPSQVLEPQWVHIAAACSRMILAASRNSFTLSRNGGLSRLGGGLSGMVACKCQMQLDDSGIVVLPVHFPFLLAGSFSCFFPHVH